MTSLSAHGRLITLVATARGMATHRTEYRYTLEGGPPAPRQIYRPFKVQFLRLSLPAGGIVVFTSFWYKPLGWGARPAGGVHTVGPWLPWPAGVIQDAQTVRSGPPMQRTASETMNRRGNQPRAGSRRQRAKLLPALPERREKMLVECDPVRDGPYRRHETQGRTWANDCPGPAILPAPAADRHGRGPDQGPHRAQPAPTSSATKVLQISWRKPETIAPQGFQQ